jgi:hypothetical protein
MPPHAEPMPRARIGPDVVALLDERAPVQFEPARPREPLR